MTPTKEPFAHLHGQCDDVRARLEEALSRLDELDDNLKNLHDGLVFMIKEATEK